VPGVLAAGAAVAAIFFNCRGEVRIKEKSSSGFSAAALAFLTISPLVFGLKYWLTSVLVQTP